MGCMARLREGEPRLRSLLGREYGEEIPKPGGSGGMSAGDEILRQVSGYDGSEELDAALAEQLSEWKSPAHIDLRQAVRATVLDLFPRLEQFLGDSG